MFVPELGLFKLTSRSAPFFVTCVFAEVPVAEVSVLLCSCCLLKFLFDKVPVLLIPAVC